MRRRPAPIAVLRARAFTVVVALLALVLGQIGLVRHLASVVHVVCAEHGGRLEEGHIGPQGGPSGASDPIEAADPGDSGHEECDLLALVLSAIAPPLGDGLLERAPSASTAEVSAPHGGDHDAGPSLLQRAPKLPPPTA